MSKQNENTETGLVKVEKELSVKDEIQMEVFATIAEDILPKLTPMLKPSFKKLKKHLDDEKKFYFLQNLEDDVVLVSVPWDDIVAFDVKPDNVKSYHLNNFVTALIKGDLSIFNSK